MSENKSLDILGIQPVAEAANKLTSGIVDGAGAFLSRICLPAAEEFGLMLRYRVHEWRAQNVQKITLSAEKKFKAYIKSESACAHPRIVGEILQQGSWIQDIEVQEMWAGLLASACTDSGTDDSNLLFVNLLAGLTRVQAHIVNYACRNAVKGLPSTGLLYSQHFEVTRDELSTLTGEQDIYRLDRELDHLRSRELLTSVGGFNVNAPELIADLTPTSLAIQLYVRSQGTRASPMEYFKLVQS